MTNIRTELDTALTSREVPYPTIGLQAKILAFAAEHRIDKEVSPAFAERTALLVIAARYFKMVEDDRWSTWLAEQDGS